MFVRRSRVDVFVFFILRDRTLWLSDGACRPPPCSVAREAQRAVASSLKPPMAIDSFYIKRYLSLLLFVNFFIVLKTFSAYHMPAPEVTFFYSSENVASVAGVESTSGINYEVFHL